MKIIDLGVIYSVVKSVFNGQADAYLKTGKRLQGTVAKGNPLFRKLEGIQFLILPAREKCNQRKIVSGTLNLDTLLSAPNVIRGLP